MKVEKAYSKGVKALKSKVKSHKEPSKSKNVDPKTGKRTGYGGKTHEELHAAHKHMKEHMR